jgi:hypothetical protein
MAQRLRPLLRGLHPPWCAGACRKNASGASSFSSSSALQWRRDRSGETTSDGEEPSTSSSFHASPSPLTALGTATIALQGWLQQHGGSSLTALAAATALSPAAAAAATTTTALSTVWSPHSRDPFGLRSLRPFRRGRAVTDALIAASVAVYALQHLAPDLALAEAFAKVNYLVAAGEWWRLVTPAFVHSGLAHLGINMLSLHWLGPPTEAALGARRFLVTYLGSAAAGNLVGYWMQSPYMVSLGASSEFFLCVCFWMFGLWSSTITALPKKTNPLNPRPQKNQRPPNNEKKPPSRASLARSSRTAC